MNTNMKLYNRIYKTYSINSFIYGLRKIPVIKNIVPANIVAGQVRKKSIIMIMDIILFIVNLFKKNLYLIILSTFMLFITEEFNTIFLSSLIVSISTLSGISNNLALYFNDINYLVIDKLRFSSKAILVKTLNRQCLEIALFSLPFIIFNFDTTLILSILYCCAMKYNGFAFINYLYKHFNYSYDLMKNPKITYVYMAYIFIFGFLHFNGLYLNDTAIYIITLLGIIMSIFSYIYINKQEDYRSFIKASYTTAIQMKSNNDFAMESIKQGYVDKIEIDTNQVYKSKGIKKFNQIFFDRHKALIAMSYQKITIGVVVACIFIIGLSLYVDMVRSFVDNFYANTSIILIGLYYVNIGSKITTIMFMNCDYVMLTYSFFKYPKLIINLYFERLKSIIRLGLFTSIVIASSACFLLFTLSKNIGFTNYLLFFIAIICASILFSIHNLNLYYLLQPYNKDFAMKSVSYMVLSFLTYFIVYGFTNLNLDMQTSSIVIIIFSIIYLIISLILIRVYAPKTFRIKN